MVYAATEDRQSLFQIIWGSKVIVCLADSLRNGTGLSKSQSNTSGGNGNWIKADLNYL